MKRTKVWRFGWLLVLALGLVLTLGLAAACDDDDDGGGDETPGVTEEAGGEASAAEIQEIEDLIKQLFESGGEQADFVFEHVTDNLIETVFFAPSREECVANAAECIGDPGIVETVSETQIDGDAASAIVVSDIGSLEVHAVREDGVWKLDSIQAASDDLPEGAASVDLGLSEFAFQLDPADIPADGNFYFHTTSRGQQAHEVIVAPVPADVELEQALDQVDESTVVAFKILIQPGQEVDIAPDAPLAPGRYALVCFFPDTADPQMAPHVEKGMLSEFTIE